jgi:hypothetical protein
MLARPSIGAYALLNVASPPKEPTARTAYRRSGPAIIIHSPGQSPNSRQDLLRSTRHVLADRGQAVSGAAVTVIAAQLGIGMSVDRPSNSGVRAPGLMLVDDRGSLAIVTHPGHQISQPGPAGRRPGIPDMAQVMKVQTGHTDGGHSLRPVRLAIEVASAQRSALRPGKTSAPGAGPVKTARCSRTSGRITLGIPTTRRPACHFGGPRTI